MLCRQDSQERSWPVGRVLAGRFSTDTCQLLLVMVFGLRPRAIIQSSLAGCVVSANSRPERVPASTASGSIPPACAPHRRTAPGRRGRGPAPDGGYASLPLITDQLAMSLGVARQVTQLLPGRHGSCRWSALRTGTQPLAEAEHRAPSCQMPLANAGHEIPWCPSRITNRRDSRFESIAPSDNTRYEGHDRVTGPSGHQPTWHRFA